MPGLFSRFFKKNKQSSSSRTPTPPITRSTTTTTINNTSAPTSTQRQSPLPPTPTAARITRIKTQASLTEQYLFSDTKDVEPTDMNDFIVTQNKNDIDLYLHHAAKLSENYFANNNQQDVYSTISSSTSSSVSLHDALFSHLSTTTDSQSEVSQYSDFPKIVVNTNKQKSDGVLLSLFDRPSYTVSDNINSKTTLTLNTTQPSLEKQEDLYYEKKYYEIYCDALQFLSNSHAQAFCLFEFIAREGAQLYSHLNHRTQFLVSFAQYRTGFMLCESICKDETNKELGYLYLHESSKNGNVRATFLLGHYAELQGDLDVAGQFYRQAAQKGLLPAKVAYGNLMLFKKSSSQLQDPISFLVDASKQGHSIASLALALYYEKNNQIKLAVEYGTLFQASPKTSIYCVGHHQVGVILLKAGSMYATEAVDHFTKAAKANYIQDGTVTKYTPSLRILGTLSRLGIGMTANPSIAFSLIQQAAKLGDEPANIILGQFYQDGIGCPVDLTKAMEIYNNYPDNIAAKLSRGLLLTEKNPEQAYRDFVDVIRFKPTPFDENHWNISSIKNEAAVRIALWEYNGICGTEKNPERAFHTLKRLSDDCNYSGAHYWLGLAYLEGVHREDGSVLVPKDQKDLAFACFLKGASQNKASCQFRVGKMLKEGYSSTAYTKQDAFSFYLQAANQNYLPALTYVGACYYTGTQGGNRDLTKAFRYFTAAAKFNDPLAIQYLADYIVKNNANGDYIDTQHVYMQLNHAAGKNQDPIAYRMLALLVHSGIDPSSTYENPTSPVFPSLHQIYKDAKVESMMNGQNLKLRFALHCLWKAIELNDHSSGQRLLDFYDQMTQDDKTKTIETFEKVESGVPNKMSFSLAQFLAKSKNSKTLALKKFIEIATYNDMTCSVGWNARIEAAKLILLMNEGKATSKVAVFTWLSEMVQYNNGKNLFTAFILLAKCHDTEICSGCDKELAPQFYENGLQCKLSDNKLEIMARMRLVEIYYNKNMDQKLLIQMDAVEPLLEALGDSSERKAWSADLYYYRGLLSLHNGTIFNYRKRAKVYLKKAAKLDHILACLELGYLYGTMEAKEDKAENCFQAVESSPKTRISFKGRITESMVQCRVENIRKSNDFLKNSDYLIEFDKMRLAAGITYSYYNLERQALDWLKEISDKPLAQIMILYYKMKDVSQRTPANILLLSKLMTPLITHSLDYYGRMALSYGQLRLGQCYENGHGVPIDNNKVLEYYNLAAVFLQNNEVYERLAEITAKNEDAASDSTNLFTTLYNAARNDTDAMFNLAQYYHKKSVQSPTDPDIPCSKAANYYYKAAQAGHTESCYFYAKYKIHQITQEQGVRAPFRSGKPATYLRLAANKNHGPSYYELGKLEIAAALYEEGIEDLKEAVFLKHGAACYQLAELNETGFIGMVSDKVVFRMLPRLDQAFKLYQLALKYGYMPAMIKLGEFFENGTLGEQNLAKAKEYYLLALQSNECPEGTAEYALGCLEETTLNMNSENASHKTAFDWFQESLRKGNKAAKLKVGTYLVHGYVTIKNRKEDVKDGIAMLEEEKENGNVQAIKELARYYQKTRHYKEAFNAWKRAAMLLDPEAYEFLAQCYEHGLLGVSIDHEEAARYKANAIEARKKALETQQSTFGFKSDVSEERK